VISFRYHVVSIVAVLLALAAGVALGGGPLSEIGRGGDEVAQRAEARSAELSRRLDAADEAGSFQDDFAETLATRSVGGVLASRPVSLVTMPGADEQVVKSLTDLLKQSGAVVGGSYAVLPRLLDGGEKSLVDTMGSQLREQLNVTGVAGSAPTYERMGGLLARAVSSGKDTGEPLDDPARELLSSLKSAELFAQTGAAEVRGSVVLVVLGDEPADPDQADSVYGGLLTGLAGQGDAVVVTGDTASARDGVLKILRDDVAVAGNVSSVDSDQTAAGRVAAVLALAADAKGTVGHYGATGIDGALPRG